MAEEKLVVKDEKPLSLRNNAEKTYGMKPTEYYFQFSPKKEGSFFSFNVSKGASSSLNPPPSFFMFMTSCS